MFDEITRLPAYYPTRTETALLEQAMVDLPAHVAPGGAVVEFGAGAATKTPLLLDAVRPSAYVPIDISGEYLEDSAAVVDADHARVEVYPVVGDFSKDVTLPSEIDGLERLGFFPGSTIGNFVPKSAAALLGHFRDILGTGSKLLIGMDRIKRSTAGRCLQRPRRRHRAIQPQPARPDQSLSRRDIRSSLQARSARADMLGRIEMHLVAQRDVDFRLTGRRSICGGQSIHTENSHKYGQRGARYCRWPVVDPNTEWLAPHEAFVIILCEALPDRFAP